MIILWVTQAKTIHSMQVTIQNMQVTIQSMHMTKIQSK